MEPHDDGNGIGVISPMRSLSLMHKTLLNRQTARPEVLFLLAVIQASSTPVALAQRPLGDKASRRTSKEEARLPNARIILNFNRDGPLYSPTIHWLSEHEFVFQKHFDSEIWNLWKHDIKSCKETPLRAFTDNLAGARSEPGWLQIAPDGRHALCSAGSGVVICSVERKVVWNHNIGWDKSNLRLNPYGFFWDSKNWIELIQDQFVDKISRIAIRRLDGSSERVVHLTQKVDTPQFGGESGIIVTPSSRLIYLVEHQTIVRGDFPNSTGSMRVMKAADIIQIDLSKTKSTPLVSQIPLPTDKFVLGGYISPNGRSIVWLTHERKNTYKAAEGLWISDLYGKRWRKFIHVPGTPPSPHFGIFEVRWLPDGKQVSLVTHAGLYIARP